MRRWFATLLLLMLPLQFSWAVVADYCAHSESATALWHLGHHDHGQDHAHDHGRDHGPAQGQVDADNGQGAATALPDGADGLVDTAGVADLDCGHSHGHSGALPAIGTAAACATLGAHPALPAGARPATRAIAPPERPQWRGPA
jgi:hypothetical protein